MTCVLCRRQQIDGHACGHCVDRIADELIQVQREVELLGAAPSLQQAHGTRGGTLASQRAPARIDVLVLRDPRTRLDETGTLGVLAVLAGWARLIREDRALDWPRRITIASERRLISTHLAWCAQQPWVDDMANELTGLLRQLQRANGTAPDKPEGRCFLRPNGDQPCAGPIWVDEANGHAHCGRCRATWDGYELHRLALILEREEAEARRPRTDDGTPMLTAQEMVDAGHASSVSNVRVRAHRAQVKAINGHYDPALFETVSA